jgi:hypothetical protein
MKKEMPGESVWQGICVGRYEMKVQKNKRKI